MLRKYINRAASGNRTIKVLRQDRIAGGLALQHFKPIGWYQNCLGYLIKPVIGPTDPLNQARGAFWGPHLNHKVNIAPINPKIER
jgi:hypothetical protein